MADFDYSEFTSDYDIAESHDTYNWAELVPVLVVYGITFCFGSIGNMLIVFATYRYRRMQNVTNVFLASLAIADLLLIIVCIPVKVAKLLSYTWEVGWFLCKGLHYIQNVSMICSVLTLTAISIERYYAIVHPMKARYICTISQAQRVILLTWFLAFFLATPTFFIQILRPVGSEHFWCTRNWESNMLWRYHEIYILIIVFIVPFCIMSLAYALICREVWNVMESRIVLTSSHALNRNQVEKQSDVIPLNEFAAATPRPQSSNRSRDDTKTLKQVICMLVVIVLVFAICWIPFLIDQVITAYGILESVRGGFFKHMATVFHLMAYFNSCINPVIYGFMSKNFRDSFRTVLCCNKESNSARYNRRITSSIRQISRTGSQTRNTVIR